MSGPYAPPVHILGGSPERAHRARMHEQFSDPGGCPPRLMREAGVDEGAE